jgi:hypothetical protein
VKPATVPFIRRYLDSPIAELRWASAFALTRFGIDGPAVADVLMEAVSRPPEKTETMSFLTCVLTPGWSRTVSRPAPAARPDSGPWRAVGSGRAVFAARTDRWLGRSAARPLL